MSNTKDDGTLRSFDSGATRDTSEGKLAYNGFLSPFVLRQFARYMNMNRVQSDGQLRAANNWQKGIPTDAYRESLSRHYQEFWEEVETRDKIPGLISRQSDIDLMAACSGMLFNIMGYMLEWLKVHPEVRFDTDEPTKEMQERLDKINSDKRVKDLMFPDEQEEHEASLRASMIPGDPDCSLKKEPVKMCPNCKWYTVEYDVHPCDCCDEDDSNWCFIS